MAAKISIRHGLRHQWSLYLFVLPALGMLLLFAYAPVSSAIYHSFFEWRGGETRRYVGFDNFSRIFSDATFWSSFGTVGILVVANIIKLIPSVLLAVLIHRLSGDRFRYFYRVLVLVPMIVPMIVTLFVWKFFLDPNIGPLNQLIESTGLKWALIQLDGVFGWGQFSADRGVGWLSQPGLIVPSLILWGFPWISSIGVLVYLAGLENIGADIYEAADLDGAGSLARFWYIELPLILTQIRMTLVLLVIGTLQSFGLQLLLLDENGGPGGRGMVPGLWMYNRAFAANEFGYACAIGLVLFLAILLLTWFNNKFVRVDK